LCKCHVEIKGYLLTYLKSVDCIFNVKGSTDDYKDASHALHRCKVLLQMSHVAWSVFLSVCVCLLGTRVSLAKTAKPIEMPFGGLTRVGPWNHVLEGVENSPQKVAVLWLSGLLKNTESLCCGVRSNRDNSILNNGI